MPTTTTTTDIPSRQLQARSPGRRTVVRVVLLAAAPLLACAGVWWLTRGARGPGGGAEDASSSAAGHWKLVWNDEFDGRRLNLDKWLVADTHGKPQFPGELNSYDPDDVDVAGGSLVLRTRELNDARRSTAPYISGRVSTQNKFEFTYGRVDVRAKLPGTQGIWPAIWMLPRDQWPPEIDVMEMLGNAPRRVYMTHHWGTRKHQEQSQSHFDGPDFTADFHVYSVEWSPGQIRWLIDGEERKVLTEHVPAGPMYLILNTAVGGDWAGAPDRTTALPQYFLIDYVRIYQHRR